MKIVVPDPAQIAAAAETIPANSAVALLNLLKFREKAKYEGDDNGEPISGREAYLTRYVPAFNAVAGGTEAAKDVKLVFIGSVAAMVIAPAHEGWDDIAIVQYPNFAAFRAVIESEEYQRSAEPHRTAALDDMRLIAILQQSDE